MTLVSVNKQTVNKKHINAALLAAGTATHAWFDDEAHTMQDQTKKATIELLGKQRKNDAQ